MSKIKLHSSWKTPLRFLCLLMTLGSFSQASAETYSLVYSLTSDRAGSIPMQGATINGEIYGRITPETGGITYIRFYLDGSSSYFKQESTAPYDLDGGPSSAADPYNSASNNTLLSDGTHTIKAVLNMDSGPDIEVNTTFTVNNNGTSNTPPILTSPGNQSDPVNSSIATVSTSATDADNDPLTFNTVNLPPGLSISNTGVISGTPTTAGSYPVQITANDGTDNSNTISFTWEITTAGGGSGCGPLTQEAESGILSGDFVIGTSTSASGGQFVEVPADTTSTGSVPSSDYAEYCFNVTQSGTYRIVGTARAAGSSYNSFHVTMNGSPSSGHAWSFPASSGFVADEISSGNGSGPVEDFTLSAGDNTVRFYLREDGAQLDNVSLVLQGGSGNNSPTLTSPGIQSDPVNSSIATVSTGATDADNDPLTFNTVNLPPGLSINSSGVISGTPTSAGTYSVQITANDGQADSNTISFTWEITTAGGSVADIIVDNLDSNTSQVGSWSVSGNSPPWGSNSYYRSDTGSFTWTPTVVVAGDYQVYAWWTTHSNRTTTAPYTISYSGGTDVVTVDQSIASVGGQWVLLGTYTFSSGSSGYIRLDSSYDNGHSFSADAVKLVNISGGGSGNNPPTLTSPGNQSDLVDSGIATVSTGATDLDSDPLTLSTVNLPPGLSINSSGVISGTPTSAGTYSVQITANDGTENSNTISFTWEITVSGSGGGSPSDCSTLDFIR